MGRFLITGLPRSRSAWFAVATGALHEPISHSSYAAFRPVWEMDRDLGVSDSGAGMWLQEIMDDFSPKVLIVERPAEEVIGSFAKYLWKGGATVDPRAIGQRLAGLQKALQVEHPLIKRVSFDSLRDHRVMEDCMSWLGVKPRNLAQLMHMRVESDLGFNLAMLRERAM